MPLIDYNFYKLNSNNKTIYVAKLLSLNLTSTPIDSFLSLEELKLLEQRKHPRKKNEFIFSRYLIKKVAGIKEENAPFVTIKYCPELATVGIFSGQYANNKNIQKKLSLSHSGNYIAFSFCSLHQKIGIDIETIDKRNIQALIKEYFCQKDQRIIARSNNSQCTFYRLWTEKEALAKLTNTPIYTLLEKSSDELNHHYQIKSFIKKDFIVTSAYYHDSE